MVENYASNLVTYKFRQARFRVSTNATKSGKHAIVAHDDGTENIIFVTPLQLSHILCGLECMRHPWNWATLVKLQLDVKVWSFYELMEKMVFHDFRSMHDNFTCWGKKWYFALSYSVVLLLLLNSLTLNWLVVKKIMTLDRCVIILHVDGEKKTFHDFRSMCDHCAC